MRHLTLIIALALSGCAFRPQLTRVAVNHNQMVADVQNETMLTNLLRAAAKQPLAFTGFSRVSGNASMSGSASASGDLPASTRIFDRNAAGALTDSTRSEGREILSTSLSGSVSGSTNFDVVVYDSQDFYNGLLTPVPVSTIAYYLRQGWPPEFLGAVLLRSVELTADSKMDLNPFTLKRGDYKKGDVLFRFVNAPGAKLSETEGDMADFLACFTMAAARGPGGATDLFRVDQLKDVTLDSLARLDGDKLDVQGSPAPGTGPDQRMIQRLTSPRDAISFVANEQCEAGSAPAAARKALAALRGPDKELRRLEVGSSLIAEVAESGKDAGSKIAISFTQRSPEGVLYFGGEYIRNCNKLPELEERSGQDTRRARCVTLPEQILDVTTVRPPATFTSARFDGQRYYIASRGSGRSTQFFTLLQQLINLQKSAKDKPTSIPVRAIN